MIQMLRPQAMRQLTDALDRAVSSNPALASARQILLQPLKLLEAFGQEVPAALANQSAALDRLRLLLQLSASTALETKRAFESPSGHASGDGHQARPCEGSVVKMGGLVVAGLAAGLVGRCMNEKLGEQMVDVIHGVALAASPAESLARSLQNGLSADQVAAALDGLGGGSAALIRISAMAPVFLDTCERARWDCLRLLFETVKHQVQLDWEGSASRSVVEVQRTKKNNLLVHLAKDEPSAALLAALDKKDAVCVLASSNGCMVVPAAQVDTKARAVTVLLPAQARAGWIGFATREGRRAAIATREEVVKYWENASENRNECLRGVRVPTEVIAGKGDDDIYPPQPLSAASWGVRILDATIVAEGNRAKLTVSLSRAEEAARVVARLDGFSEPLTLTLDGAEPWLLLPAALARAPIRGTVSVYANHRTDPDDERELRGGDVTAQEQASHGGSSRRPGDPPGNGSATNGNGAPAWPTPGARRRYVAVVRPVFVAGAQIVRASAQHVSSLRRALSAVAVVEELPFVRDEDLVVQGHLGDVSGPAGALLLERLAALVGRTSGLEDATLLVLVPPEVAGSRLDFLAAACDGVSTLVLATPEGAAANIGPVSGPAPLKTDRLRVVGRILRDDIVVTEPLRDELRAAGPGAPFLTPFVAVALDLRGEARMTQRIRVMNPSRSGPFAALLPITADVVSVELRFQPETLALELRSQPEGVFANLASIEGPVVTKPFNPNAMIAPLPSFGRPQRRPLPVLSRPTGKPEVQISLLSSKEVQWSASHSRGVRSQIELEVGRKRGDGGVVWTRLESFGAGRSARDAALGLDRPLPGPGIEQLRIIASDGWNAVHEARPLLIAQGALRIRSIAVDRYWLDLAQPRGTNVTWSVWHPEVFARRPRPSGPISLSAPGSSAIGLHSGGSVGPMRPELVSKIGDVFEARAEDSGAILLASFDGDEDFVLIPPLVRS